MEKMPSYESPSNQEILGKKRCKTKNICDRPLTNQQCLDCCKNLNSSLILSSGNYNPHISNSLNCEPTSRDAQNSYSKLCCCGDDPLILQQIISTLIAKYFACYKQTENKLISINSFTNSCEITGNTDGTFQTTLSIPFQITEEIKNYKNDSNCYYKTADIPKIFFKDANLKKGRGSKRKCFKRKTQIDSSKLHKNKLHSTHPIRDSASDNININTKISKIPIATKQYTTEKVRNSTNPADKQSINSDNESKYSSNKQSKGQPSNYSNNQQSRTQKGDEIDQLSLNGNNLHTENNKTATLSKLDLVANERSINKKNTSSPLNISGKTNLQNSKVNDSQYSDTQNRQQSDKYKTANNSQLPETNENNNKTNDMTKDRLSTIKDEEIKMSQKSDLLSEKTGTTSMPVTSPDMQEMAQQQNIQSSKHQEESGIQKPSEYNNLKSAKETKNFDNRNKREKSYAIESDLEKIENSNDISTKLKNTRSSKHDMEKFSLKDRLDFDKTEQTIIDLVKEHGSTLTNPQISRKSNYSKNKISTRIHWREEINNTNTQSDGRKSFSVDSGKNEQKNLKLVRRKNYHKDNISTRLHWVKA